MRIRQATAAMATVLTWASAALYAQAPAAPAPDHYEPTLDSLNRHPLPQWYADAKLGIFIHWGLYSVPGFAPVRHSHDFDAGDYMKDDPYAEWYYNTMRIPGSATQKYQLEHYGSLYNYYDFSKDFNRETAKWDPAKMAAAFQMAGARYVVLTSKHHEGFALWPTEVTNPNQDGLRAKRDIVGELSAAVRADGLKMGLYYSGGYDWTFNRGPIEQAPDGENVKPETVAYGRYADAQAEELIARYHPAILWNDIDWPKSGNALKIIADYYNAVPDGVVDDRFGVKHADFTSPEYTKLDHISPTKWEECRGLGESFGYNRAEGEADTIAPKALVALLVDIVSKNGNLLLDVGPEADGTIPPVQMSRLVALGGWLKQNGEAIYGTTPWTHAEGTVTDAAGKSIPVRYMRKGSTLFVTLLEHPAAGPLTINDVPAVSAVRVLGGASVNATAAGTGLRIGAPAWSGEYAWTLALDGALSPASPR